MASELLADHEAETECVAVFLKAGGKPVPEIAGSGFATLDEFRGLLRAQLGSWLSL
jgi:hypothetical protein